MKEKDKRYKKKPTRFYIVDSVNNLNVRSNSEYIGVGLTPEDAVADFQRESTSKKMFLFEAEYIGEIKETCKIEILK